MDIIEDFIGHPKKEEDETDCYICGKSSPFISASIAVCGQCIYKEPDQALELIMAVHKKSRKEYGLIEEPPKAPEGIKCNLCVNECSIAPGQRGYCDLRENKDGKIVSVTDYPLIGKVSAYYDPLPTNCVGDRVCPGGTGSGYPDYACRSGPEYGYKNLAVFYEGCSYNCLFCQNWHFKLEKSKEIMTPEELIESLDDKASCICYFGGDPSVQMAHSIKTSRLALEKRKGKIMRICWETNGTMNRKVLEEAGEIAIKSGGLIKFDLKAFDENLHIALTGITNKRTIENFSYMAERFKERPNPPCVIASTLMIPGYVEAEEVKKIAEFIAGFDRRIPYSLLAFHKGFYFNDLPSPSKKMAEDCLAAAEGAGLEHVSIGNAQLLT